MRPFPRSIVLGVALAVAATSAAAQRRGAKPRPVSPSWTGVWSGPWCVEAIGGGPSSECGTFTLTLVQRRDRLCGRHVTVAAGAGKRNDGAAQSVIGKVRGNQATIVVTPGGGTTSWLAKASRNGRRLEWRVIERVAAASGASQRPSELAASATLSLSRDRPATGRVGEECQAHFASAD